MINKFGIYMIKNKINEKVYIGKTEESFKRRWWHHSGLLKGNYHHNIHLQRAWNKYGEENFEFIILQICNESDDINKLEQEYIEKYNSFNSGYNQTLGGEGALGNRLSDESKRLIGEKNKINMTGKKHTEKTKKKMSEVHKGYIKSKEHRKNLSESLKGKIVSEETRMKNRIANQGSNQPTAKYTEELIYEIKLKLKNGYTAKQINEEYNIPIGYIYQIKGNHRWKHVVV